MTRSEFKTPTTLYLPVKIIKKLRKESDKRDTSVSRVVSIILAKYYKTIEKTQNNNKPQIITCSECGAEYSSKLKTCPKCETKELKDKKKKEREEKLKKEKKLKKKKLKKIKEEKKKLERLIQHRKQGQATENEIIRQRRKVKELERVLK